MIILGIDPGTQVTGYGIINMSEEGGYTLIDYGCIRPPQKLLIHDRYLIIHEGAEELIKKYQPEAL
ncbi:MAG: crossover junction endodeoxyribonuclease RuvC, partial [Chlamydiota bacterium]